MEDFCFIIPPHLERRTRQNTADVAEEIRRQRAGAVVLKRSLARGNPNNDNLDDQDVFTAKSTFRLPGWKLADTEKQADDAQNKTVNVCWDNTKDVMDFYKNVLSFDLKEELDGQVVSTINVGQFFNNAFFNGQQMAYGEGDGRFFKDFCADKSVICHELGHAVVNSTVPLTYYSESGALNESYADVFAISYMHYKTGKSFSQLTKKDWMIGDRCVVGKGALRSFTKTPSRPSSHPLGPDSEPRHYDNRFTGNEDNGGVHINSSIINHAFYKVCKKWGGKSWEEPLQIWFSLLKHKKIPHYATFDIFAKELLLAAKEMYGDKMAEIVKTSLNEVGLLILNVKKRRKRRVKKKVL
jgi:Zn-dependent metalloprotease